MFERYTEKARRIIFFARYEASQFGSPYIETEHLLLGLLREDKALTHRFLRGNEQVELIRKQIEDVTVQREKVSTSVDLPLSNECKRVLGYAAEEAESLADKHIGSEHLLLGLLREEKSFAAQLLHERGLRLSVVREELAQNKHHQNEPAPRAKDQGILASFITSLTQLAHEERLLPLVGREKEMQQIMHLLGRSSKNNPVLVGETGVGKKTIVEGLIQRAADSVAPAYIANKIFAAMDLSMLVTAARHSAKPKEFISAATAEMIRYGANMVFVFDELHMLLSDPPAGAHEITLLLKTALLGGKIRCIAMATPEEYRAALRKARWLERCFLSVAVQPATEDEAVVVLQVIKDRLEKFHSVRYTEEALRAAVIYSNRCIKHHSLPEKAVELIDDAGAYVKMKYETAALPQEIIEARRRLKFIGRRTESAVANHEFEKARFYSDEERREREKLLELQKKHNIEDEHVGTVAEEQIIEALARWTGASPERIREMTAHVEMKAGKAQQPARKRKQTKKKSS